MEKELFNRLDPNDKFWQCINEAKGNREKFYQILSSLTLDELRAFKREFLLIPIWKSEEDLKILKQITSNLTREDYKNINRYVISQGYDYYEYIRENIHRLPLNIKGDNPRILYDLIGKVIQDKYTNELFDHKNPENKFWKHIEASQKSKEKFYQLIWHMSLEELRAYEEEFDLAQETLWREGEEIGSGDDLEEIRLYVISQGYDYFMQVIRGTRKLPQFIGEEYKKILKGTIAWVMYDKYEAY